MCVCACATGCSNHVQEVTVACVRVHLRASAIDCSNHMQQVAAGKFMVVEGQMMGSMKWHNQPLPCELSDVANAIFDGADAVMLGSPTSIGINPVEVSKFKLISRHLIHEIELSMLKASECQCIFLS